MDPVMRRLNKDLTAVWNGRDIQLVNQRTNERTILSMEAQINLVRLLEEIVTKDLRDQL